MDITGTPMRTLRAALFTALCVTLSTASHVLLSGVPLPVTTVAALSAAVFATAWALAGRQRGFAAIAALLIPLELAADTVFTTGQHACYGQAGGPVAGPLRSVGVDLLCAGGDFGTPLARVASQGAPGLGRAAGFPQIASDPAAPWLLLAAHLAVGLAAAAWLWRGEAALGRLVRAAAVSAFRPLLVAAAAASAAGARRPRLRAASPARAASRTHPLLVHSVVRRGPPCPAAL
ncbi:hypothetical protein AB0C51_19580 [Streptomyces pathocidini]|uniref:hypothetical protein n=1 Tax=Streptomyces pathocidini TaxID=1650571 RepID=UPI0033E86B80